MLDNGSFLEAGGGDEIIQHKAEKRHLIKTSNCSLQSYNRKRVSAISTILTKKMC